MRRIFRKWVRPASSSIATSDHAICFWMVRLAKVHSQRRTIDSGWGSNRWANQSVVTICCGPASSTFDYTEGFLSSIEHPTGSESTFEFNSEVEEGSGLLHFAINDMAAEPQHRRKLVGLSGSVTQINGQIYPTAVGNTRMVINGEAELTYLSFDEWIYTGGGRLHKALDYDENAKTYFAKRYVKDGWEVELDKNDKVQLNGTLEGDSRTASVGGVG